MVDEPTGRRDENVDAAAHSGDLAPERCTAEYRCDGHARLAAIGFEALGNLRCQFSCRRQNEHTRALALGGTTVGGEPVQDRQREGRRLSGARLRDTQQVLSLQNAWDGLRLNRGRRRVTLRVKRLKQCGVQSKFGKRGQFKLFHIARTTSPAEPVSAVRARTRRSIETPRVAWAVM